MGDLKKLGTGNRVTKGKVATDIKPVYQSEYNILVDYINNNLNTALEVSYDSLVSMEYDTGHLYSFDYTTKHLIPNTSIIHTGVTEKLIVLAISPTQLSKNAYSLTYPTDVIEFDITDNLCEDNTTQRTGFITYRKDVNNNSTPYDFRNVKFRRWTLDAPAWISDEVSLRGTLKKYNNVLYSKLYTNGYDFDGTATPDVSRDWTKIIDLTKSDYVAVKEYTGADSNFGNFLNTNVTYPLYKDYYTFTNSSGEEKSSWFRNITIQPYTTLNNIIFIETGANHTYNISFDVDCYNFTFLDTNTDITFGKDSHDFYIMSSNTNLTFGNGNKTSIIGDANLHISVGNANSMNIGNDNKSISIGNGNFILIFGGNNTSISVGNDNNMTRWNTLRDGNSSITINNSCFDLSLKDTNAGIIFADTSADIVFGDLNSSITFVGAGAGTIFEDTNTNMVFNPGSLTGEINSNNTVLFGSNNANNIFESGAGITNIDLSGATHLKASYTCHIFSREDLTPKLSYYNNSNVQQIVAITS